ncbi:MAG: hypothetical protein GY801_24505 [bacterium]|nr:hypothetical protein [bacterium]
MTVVFSMVGCNLFDRDSDRILTSPGIQSDVEIFGNFIAADGISKKFQVTLPRRGFKINIPIPGEYLVTYVMPGIKPYNLVLRVHTPSLVAIGAPGPLKAIFIRAGAIKGNPAPRARSGAVWLFNWPKRPWKHLFTPSGARISLPLSGAGVVWKPQFPEAKKIVIAAVGDSITYGKGSNSGGYVSKLEQKLRAAGYDVVLRKKAVPGEQAASTNARFSSAIAGADIALIMIGTNNVVNPYTCPSPGFCNAGLHVGSMVRKAITAGVRPFISTIPPIRASCESIWPNYDVRRLNAQYAVISRSRNVPLVNNYDPILRSGGDSLFVDCLHFNDRGYNVIASRFFKALLAHKVLSK